MQVVTLNANGIRSACKKGFLDWMVRQKAEVVCIQETRSHSHQLPRPVLNPPGWFGYFRDAEKPGYSGVAIYSRREPDRLVETIGWDDADREGRYIQADFGALSIASIYLPSGTSGEERQAVKYDFMEQLMPVLKRMRGDRQRQYILCGDWNIAHTKKDIKNWRGNQKHTGFLPEERAWLGEVFGRVGMVDAFRKVNQEEDQYTWWSNRGRAWENNVGWRIDYQVVTPGLGKKVKSARIYKDKRFSDHAPLIVDYDLTMPG